MEHELIPFGKYKDKPIEILSKDKKYVEWLLAQDWFRNKYQSLYTVVINNFHEPQDTPEHNALQGLFLDDDFCIKFSKIIAPSYFKEEILSSYRDQYTRRFEVKSEFIKSIKVHDIQFEKSGIDVSFSLDITYTNSYERREGTIEWEKRSFGETFYSNIFKIEIKPSIGDDYPTVLRQMRDLGCNILFLGEYHGIGLNLENFIKLFNKQKIRIVFKNQII